MLHLSVFNFAFSLLCFEISRIDLVGHMCMHAIHKLHAHFSITYFWPIFMIAFLGQIETQLSQEMHVSFISKKGIIKIYSP